MNAAEILAYRRLVDVDLIVQGPSPEAKTNDFNELRCIGNIKFLIENLHVVDVASVADPDRFIHSISG